jgi:hypothetical protein
LEFCQVGEGVSVKEFVCKNTPERFSGRVIVGAASSAPGPLQAHFLALIRDIAGIKLRAPVGMKY